MANKLVQEARTAIQVASDVLRLHAYTSREAIKRAVSRAKLAFNRATVNPEVNSNAVVDLFLSMENMARKAKRVGM